MENLLRKSGLLNEDDETDLGTLEKKIAHQGGGGQDGTPDTSKSGSQPPILDSPHSATHLDDSHSPNVPTKSPETGKNEPEGVEELSDMMCTLVTNNCGDTRYVGKYIIVLSSRSTPANNHEDHLLASPFSRQKASNGLTRRQATLPFRI